MTALQIQLVKKTWKILRGVDPALIGDVFYSKLFADNPSFRMMFPKDLSVQYKKLVDTLSAIVARLDDLSVITDDITAMAKRHTGYGVEPAHYTKVGEALIWTLRHGLGNEWNTATEEAWVGCYTTLSETMIHAASDAA